MANKSHESPKNAKKEPKFKTVKEKRAAKKAKKEGK